MPADPPAALPELLEDVPASERVRESLGVPVGALGAGTVLVATMQWARGAASATVSLCLLVAGLGFVALEMRRHAMRLVLVPRGDRLGVYRLGRLTAAIDRTQVGEFELHPWNTLKMLAAPALLALLFLAVGITSLSTDLAAGVTWIVAAAPVVLIVWTTLHERVRLRWLLLPTARSSRRVGVLRSQFDLVGPGLHAAQWRKKAR